MLDCAHGSHPAAEATHDQRRSKQKLLCCAVKLRGGFAGKDGKPAAGRALADKDSQNTLTPADLTARWRGPAPRKDSRHAV